MDCKKYAKNRSKRYSAAANGGSKNIVQLLMRFYCEEMQPTKSSDVRFHSSGVVRNNRLDVRGTFRAPMEAGSSARSVSRRQAQRCE